MIEGNSVGFHVRGFAPVDPWFTRKARRDFWHAVSKIVIDVKRASLARGLDKTGRPMVAISPLTKQARRDNINSVTDRRPYSPMGRAAEDNPPLQATAARSRTQKLMEARVEQNGVWVTWRRDPFTKLPWGRILARHARGFFQFFRYPHRGWGFVPARDVIGLSSDDQKEVQRRATAWWQRERPKYAPAAAPSAAVTVPTFPTRPGPTPTPPAPGRGPRRPGGYQWPDEVWSTIEVIGIGSGGNTYGPGTRVSAKLINRGMKVPPLPPFGALGRVPLPPTPSAGPAAAARPRPNGPPPGFKPANPKRPVPVMTLKPDQITAFMGLNLDARIPAKLHQALPPELVWVTRFKDFSVEAAALDWWVMFGVTLLEQINRGTA